LSGGTIDCGPPVGRKEDRLDQREDPRKTRYTRHEVAAPRTVGPSGRTRLELEARAFCVGGDGLVDLQRKGQRGAAVLARDHRRGTGANGVEEGRDLQP
jgi:hypothetical protein